jgi:hypothetical protein
MTSITAGAAIEASPRPSCARSTNANETNETASSPKLACWIQPRGPSASALIGSAIGS